MAIHMPGVVAQAFEPGAFRCVWQGSFRGGKIVDAIGNQHLEAFDEDAYRHGRAQASCKAFI
ncbi:hypothetical protein D3C71_1420080 [compost metagenome]